MPLPRSIQGVTRSLSPDQVRRTTLLFADPPPAALPPEERVTRAPIRPVDEPHPRYPWENLAFEGGGAKGYAYIGAVQVLEREGIYPQHVRRVAGTSVGSILAMFAAVGAPSDYMLERVPTDLPGLVMDGSGGKVGSVLRTAVTRGMHPGQRTYAFLGAVLEEHTGSADVTFAQLLERCGRELCVPVTNVTRMMTEYCHPKTTPNMPVRVAVRMSMSLPVLLQPVFLQHFGLDDTASAEVYVDGGLLCNNPTHAFDGWWLSMDRADAFLRRLQPLELAHESYPRSVRFSPANPKTLGFTLFSADEADITRAWVRPGGDPPPRPDTPAVHETEASEGKRARTSRIHQPLQRLLGVLDDYDVNQDGTISLDELTAAIEHGGISSVELLDIFGTTSVPEIFAAINEDGSDAIDFGELVNFIESVGVDVTTQLVGFPERPPKTLLEFAGNLLDAMSRDLTRANHTPDDRARTIPIATDYVGTQTFNLEPRDMEFLLESARRATKAFLLEYDSLHP
ncbi:MAG: patatin-like phospholipase family protein [Candidatus Nanopelagicales bacterium]